MNDDREWGWWFVLVWGIVTSGDEASHGPV